MRRDVAVDVHQVESAVHVQLRLSDAVNFFSRNHHASEPHEFQQACRNYHGSINRIPHLHANSVEVFHECELDVDDRTSASALVA